MTEPTKTTDTEKENPPENAQSILDFGAARSEERRVGKECRL